MRFATITALVLLTLSQASANGVSGGGGGGGGSGVKKFTTLAITNKCDGAVEVNINGTMLATLEPRESTSFSLSVPKGSQTTLAVSATLVGTAVNTSNSVTMQAEKKTTATITAPTTSSLAISYSGPGLVAAHYRETGILLASSGGLLPLLGLAMWLGRRSRRRD